jgi:SprT protein
MNMVNGMPHATLLRLFDLRKRLLALFPQYELPNSSAAIISMNPKMRTVLGRAFYRQYKINLNPVLLSDENELESTFAHELAHLVAVEIFGKCGAGHGRKWKWVMKTMGYPPERCGNFAAAEALRRPQKIQTYVECRCGIAHPFKTGAYRRMLGGAKFVCRTCRDCLTTIFKKDENLE